MWALSAALAAADGCKLCPSIEQQDAALVSLARGTVKPFLNSPPATNAQQIPSADCDSMEKVIASPPSIDHRYPGGSAYVRRVAQQFVRDGMVTFTVISLIPEGPNVGRQLKQEPSSFRNHVRGFVASVVRHDDGHAPLVVCTNQHTKRQAEHLVGANSSSPFVLNQLRWPGKGGGRRVATHDSGVNRDLDPAVNLKYLWAYFLVRCGFSAFFLDADTRLLKRPHPFIAIQQRRGIYYTTLPQHMPDMLAQLDMASGMSELLMNKFQVLDERPLRPFASTAPAAVECVAKKNFYHYCEGKGRYLCINTGMMVFFPGNGSELVLNAMLHLLEASWDSWWEQTMCNFVVARLLESGELKFDWLEPTMFQYLHATTKRHELVVAHGGIDQHRWIDQGHIER